jgi:cobalt-zinc-cadmium efflux system outer membrane protein
MAATNSPALHEAAAAVAMARGNLIQSGTYKNPNVSYQTQPSNNGAVAGVMYLGIDQPVSTGGKLKLQVAAAQKDLENAELALVRARSDLSTQVRNAYFGLLVAKETARVNKALAKLTDDIYRMQTDLFAKGGIAADYEPAALRAQAITARLALNQSIANYIMAWKQLAVAIGLHDAPLTEVAGRIDVAIPYFDYDKIRDYILTHHTDSLIARNGIEKAHYSLKLARLIPRMPDIDVAFGIGKDLALPPYGTAATVSFTAPLTLWDNNRGNIIAAQGAFYQAIEEPRRVETALTTSLNTQYLAYRTNLLALEDYRKYILPDQMRALRGVYQRRRFDITGTVAFADVVSAQQNFATSVSTYLGLLASMWTSAVAVADLLETDDMFQFSEARPVPPIPDMEQLLRLDFSQAYPRLPLGVAH